MACVGCFAACNEETPVPAPTRESGSNTGQRFTEVTSEAGLNFAHGLLSPEPKQAESISGGVAAGDYDGDGWIDLYVVRGTIGPNLLFRNLRNGTFREADSRSGVGLTDSTGSGPAFADLDGDGYLDLYIGGIHPTRPRLFRNTGQGRFQEITQSAGIDPRSPNNFSAAFGDYDLDGDLDLVMSHWLSGIVEPGSSSEHLWRNDGKGGFEDVSTSSGITDVYLNGRDYTFTPNFADVNDDGLPDILMAADFGTSRVFLNNGNSTFRDATTPVISDENGMGAAVGDYDNDLDLDWFVSSISEPGGGQVGTWGISGNRLYRNIGDGLFDDATEGSGVRHGDWGWAACFADFNNDGHLDIFHVNGWNRDQGIASAFLEDRSRLFISNGNGTFEETAVELGIDDTGQGRGIVCFDYDRDGDVDIFVANNNQPPRLYRNDLGNERNYLDIRLRGLPPNTQAIGARILIDVDGRKQMRELRAGCNFVSQNPAEAHFGVANARLIDEILVIWPDGQRTTLTNVDANRLLTVFHPSR